MANKGAPEMTPEMMEAFKAFYKLYTSLESVLKEHAAGGESSTQAEAEKSNPSTQMIPSIPASTSAPLSSSVTPVVPEFEAIEETPPVAVPGVICLPFEPIASIPASDTNMAEVDAVIEDVVKSIDKDPLSDGDSPMLDIVALAEAAVQSAAREHEPDAEPPIHADSAADSPIHDAANEPPISSSFTPARYQDMSSLDVVKDVLGLAPQPLVTIPPGEPENPLDCDRDIDLAPIARDLLKEGKAGKLPICSSARIREDTISKLIKKGDERRERKKAAASNPERGLIDEVSPKKVSEVEPSFDDSKDVNFKPTSQHVSSESGDAGYAVEKPQFSKKAKRKLDVDPVTVIAKSVSKSKKQKLPSPAGSSHTAPAEPSLKAQPKKVNELSSSDSSLSKKGKARRQKSVAPAPSKKTTTPRVSPRSTIHATAGKASGARSRKYVGQSSTPTLTSMDETVSMQMISEAHSSRFVSQLDHAALSVLKSREFRSEKRINPPMFIKYGIDVLLKERGLWLTLTNVFPYNLNVVREFYANLSPECGLVESPRYGKVYIRGSFYSFSPAVINDFFGLPSVEIPDWCLDGKVEKALVTELTGGKVKKWDSRFQSTKLTCKYVVLHKIAVACWMLSKNTQILTKDQALMIYRVEKGLPVNFGQLVFNAVMKASSDTSGSLFYPNVIFQVLTGQRLDATPSEGVEIEQLTFATSLLSSDRKQDLPYKGKASRKVHVPSDSDDSLFEEINQFKGSAAAGPSGQSVSKYVRVVLASLPTLIQTAKSLVHALKDANDVLSAVVPSLSDAES